MIKAAHECHSLAEVRQEIDRIDQQVIKLWGQRFQYVLAAAPFKQDQVAVHAPERFRAMLADRRAWASAEGLNPELIAKIYTDLVQYFIDEELKHWQKQ